MCQLGKPIPDELALMRRTIEEATRRSGFTCIDATTRTTGKDFLHKIWEMLLSVPVGIALLHSEITPGTMQNVFFEMGILQAYGKDTLIVRSPSAPECPSDLVRTEYVIFDEDLDNKIDHFFEAIQERAKYFLVAAEQLENNPMLALDYLRRAYLISPSDSIAATRDELMTAPGLETRARNSVEQLAASFCNVEKSLS